MHRSLRLLWTLLLPALALAACDDGGGDDGLIPLMPDADGGEPEPDPPAEPEPDPPAFCEGATAQKYDPFGSTELELFPDDALTRLDPDSPTGLRLDLAASAWAPEMPRMFAQSVVDMDVLSGFGRNGAVVLRFTGAIEPVADGADASLDSEALALLDLDADPPERVPFTVTYSEGGQTLMVQPMRPLRAGALHGLVLTTAHPASDGGCVAPSDALRGLLIGQVTDPRLERLVPHYERLLAAAGLGAAEVSAATVFTTHRDLDVFTEIGADIQARDYTWSEGPTCTAQDRWRLCEGAFVAWDYRDDLAVRTATPKAEWTLPVSIWLPLDARGPVPTLFVGHGLGSGRGQAERLAELWTPSGYAVVAMDALRHGEHPTSTGGDGSETALGFLGLNLTGLQANGRQLIGNFNQTVLDRLQGLRLIRQAPDIDGDGAADLDVERIGYYGVSLGGLLGPGLAALDPTLDMAVWQVPGGHLSTFVTASEELESFMPALANLVGGKDRFDRLIPLLQAAIDSADPATWAPSVLRDRPGGGGPLHLLMAVSTFDEVVPPPTGRYLARALGLPHVGPVFDPVDFVEQVPAPVKSNTPDGVSTVGYTQLDRITENGVVEESRHASTPLSLEAQHQARAFIEPWADGGEPLVIDPYAELGTPPLP